MCAAKSQKGQTGSLTRCRRQAENEECSLVRTLFFLLPFRPFFRNLEDHTQLAVKLQETPELARRRERRAGQGTAEEKKKAGCTISGPAGTRPGRGAGRDVGDAGETGFSGNNFFISFSRNGRTKNISK